MPGWILVPITAFIFGCVSAFDTSSFFTYLYAAPTELSRVQLSLLLVCYLNGLEPVQYHLWNRRIDAE
jgi:hypothetical protein